MAETTTLKNLDIKDFTIVSGINTGDFILLATSSGSDGKMQVGSLTTYLVNLSRPQVGDNGNWVFKDGETIVLDTGIASEGRTPTFKKGTPDSAAILWKYESEDEAAWRNLIEWSDIKINVDELTEEQLRKIKLNYEDLTAENIAELQRPATEAAERADAATERAKAAADGYDAAKASITQAVSDASSAKTSAEAAETAAKAAQAAAEEQKSQTITYLNTVKSDEQARVNAEAERVKAETARAKEEAARAKAETSRDNAESARVKAETDRQNAWAAWFENASTGVKALWTSWFNATKQAWSDWFGATESAGVRKTWTDWFTSIKNAWSEFNTTASQAETARVNAENTRRLQEVERVSAEQDRASEFATIKSDAAKATSAANSAAASANAAATNANNKAVLANTAAANSDKQTALCKSATDLAEELNAHPQIQGENGNWWKWNTETNEYEDTGIIARGGGMYPMVRSRRNHVIWYDSTDGFKERIVRRRNHTIIKL